MLTQEQKLAAVIEKAVGNGWDVGLWDFCIKDGVCLDTAYLPAIIFSHDFAKAFWGEETKCDECEGEGVIWHPMWRQWNNEEHDKYVDLIGKNKDFSGEDAYDRKMYEFFGVSDRYQMPKEEPECHSCNGTGEGKSYKYHLQQLSLTPDDERLDYLYKFI